MQNDNTLYGTVKFFNNESGYGFIKPDDGGNDVFVHVNSLKSSDLSSLEKDQPISYELEENRRNGKMQACNICLL